MKNLVRWYLAGWLALVALIALTPDPVRSEFTLNELNGFNVASTTAASAPSITYVDTYVDTSAQTTYTFTSVGIGTAAADRVLVIAACVEQSGVGANISGLTIDGVAGFEQVHTHGAVYGGAGTSSLVQCAIYSRPWTTGTTATIVFTGLGINSTFGSISVWAGNGISWNAIGRGSAFDTASANISANLDYAQNPGIAVGICVTQDAAQTATWVGLTEDENTNSSSTVSAAHASTSATTLSVSCDMTGTGDATLLTAAFGATSTPNMAFIGCTNNNSANTTYTSGSLDIGEPDSTRIVFGVYVSEDSATNYSISSSTIGGSAAAEQADTANTGTAVQTAIYSRAIATGTTAVFSVTYSEAITNHTDCVFVAYNLTSATAVASVTGGGANPVSLNLNTSAGDIVIGGCDQTGTGTTPTNTGWQQYFAQVGGAAFSWEALGEKGAKAGSPTSGSCTFAVTTQSGAMASFR